MMTETFYRIVETICGAAMLIFAAECVGADFWRSVGFAFFVIAALGYLTSGRPGAHQ